MSVGNETIFLPNINAHYRRDVFDEMFMKTLFKQNFIDVKETFFLIKTNRNYLITSKLLGGKYF